MLFEDQGGHDQGIKCTGESPYQHLERADEGDRNERYMHLYNKAFIVRGRKYGANIGIAFGRNLRNPPPRAHPVYVWSLPLDV